ncbi:hypothetical protein BD779DRAFT_1673946 [Infundibulicybe gibba]|nr:hypothetical protein BD779DRAFT_1673946 [Infundibulicybe gibba]
MQSSTIPANMRDHSPQTVIFVLPDGCNLELEIVSDSITGGKQAVRCDLCGTEIQLSSKGGLALFSTHRDSRKCQGLRATAQAQLAKKKIQSIRHQASLSFQMMHGSTPSSLVSGTASSTTPPTVGTPYTISPPSSPQPSISNHSSSDHNSSNEDSDSESQGASLECTGILVHWAPGNIWDTYPYHRHAAQGLPWEVAGFEPNNDYHIRLQSTKCMIYLNKHDDLEKNALACHQCLYIPNSTPFRTFMAKAAELEPASKFTSRLYLSQKQLRNVLAKVTADNQALRLQALNTDRRISTLTKRVNDHQRIVILLSTNNIPGLRRLVTSALKNGASLQVLVRRLEGAAMGTYSAYGKWSQRELDIAFLAKALGGPRLLYALQKAEGYPSLSTVQQRRIACLLPSASGKPVPAIYPHLLIFTDKY